MIENGGPVLAQGTRTGKHCLSCIFLSPLVVIAAVVIVNSWIPCTSYAASPACNRARAIADKARLAAREAHPNHREILGRLKTAEDLCPSLADIYSVAYCSAVALEDTSEMERLKRRAVFHRVDPAALICDVARTADEDLQPEVAPLPTMVRQKFALVIGIGLFEDERIPSLKYAAKDAADMAAFLTQGGNFQRSNVRLLIDQKATRENILKAIQWLALSAREDDLVVLFISSHGSPKRGSQDLNGVGYIITHDSDYGSLFVDALDFGAFTEKASRIEARRLVVFLDTCFSGQGLEPGSKSLTVNGLGVNKTTAELFLSGTGTYVITSSTATEKSWESDRLKNGYFTHHLLQALQATPSKPPTINEVFEQLTYSVATAVARDKHAPQHPQIHPKNGIGDVRIGVIPTLKPAR